ncbi:DUF3034 family protein [Altererythrobacter sp. SALINAS58]|uniref:DUF3034 family protein n=1 Tax=Alteripontixanthobacter muriae TaxID=2705546 RepID=UPI001575BB19|nr:DUF3034 family protein [Alteripontixanthobacter muriae]NTZ44121.1 DUF3034 family protein [Alteripontixanthobacter muriae]
MFRTLYPHRLIAALGLSLGLAPSPAMAERLDLFEGEKLVLTNAVSSIEGSSGGGLATWATIGGMGTEDGIGVTGHVTGIELSDFGWRSYGVAVGIANRLELSYARQSLDTRDVGTELGLGRGFTLDQDVFAAKLKLAGDLVYGDPLMPQIALGVQHKRNLDKQVVRAVGALEGNGTDITLSATKLFLSHSLLANATARLTKGNQSGLLGFGQNYPAGSRLDGDDYSLQFEGSLAYQLSRRLIVGAEYRTMPDDLPVARQDDWLDVFAAYVVDDNVTVTAAYVDLGSIATFDDQRGALLSAQLAF